MTHKVRIPYVFVVRKVTWRPAGEPMPVDATPQLTVANGVSLPIEDMNLHIDPATYDALVEQGKREYYAEKAAKAKAARAAEEAKWEPMPIPPGASRPLAALYGNTRRRKQPSPAAEPDSQSDAATDPWAGWDETAKPLDAPSAPIVSATGKTLGEDAPPSLSAGLDLIVDRSQSKDDAFGLIVSNTTISDTVSTSKPASVSPSDADVTAPQDKSGRNTQLKQPSSGRLLLIQDQEEVPDGEPLNENGEPLRDQEELDRSTYRTYCDELRKLDPTNPALDTVGPVNSSPTAADIKRVESALAKVRARQTTVDTTKTPQIDPLDPLGTHTELRSGAETFLPPAAEKIISSSRPDFEKQVLLDGSLQRVKSGGMPAANADFDSMQPQDVKTYPNNTRVGVLEEGTQVVVRAKSQPTVEINTLSGLCYVIRYGQ